MNVTVILIGTGGELDRKTVTVNPDSGITLAKLSRLIDWDLADGDTIRIITEE